MTRSNLPVAFTGAAGRVGRRVLPLLCKDWNIKGVDLRPENVAGVEIHPADLLDLDATLNALRGVGSIVHSAIASYPMDGRDPDADTPARRAYNCNMLDVNIRGTYHVFEAARILQIPQVIYLSSLTVLTGYLPENPELEETLSPNPNNLYACTKLFGEQLAHIYNRKYGIRTICLRLGQPYPLGHPKEALWKEDPYTRAFFVSYADIASAIACALRATDVQRGIYNIVSKNATDILAHSAAGEIGFAPEDYC